MSNTKRHRCAGALAIALGIGTAAMTHPGVVYADPLAEPSPGVSQVESPGSGGPDSKAELGVVSSGGSTSPVGEGFDGAGPGSDDTSGPGLAFGSTGSTFEPAPGVSISSSGGALTSGDDGPPPPFASTGADPGTDPSTGSTATSTDAQPIVPEESASQETAAQVVVEQVVVPTEEATPSTAGPTPAVATVDDQAIAATGVTWRSAPKSHGLAVQEISELPSSTVLLGGGGGVGIVGEEGGGQQLAATGSGDSDVTTLAARRVSTEPDDDPSTREALRTFTGVLAAALAPFVAPVPGGPADTPTLWAVLAWVRRQSERVTGADRPELIATPRQTEMVLANAEAPGAVVDRIDRTTGRVTGRINLADAADGERYALAHPVDRRLGTVAIDAATGQWTFTPHPSARLDAHDQDTVAMFSVTATNGQTADVRAPVVPAEAVVTDTIDVGNGLTYGLAVVGDRLYVLNGSADAAGNGSVKIVDTASKTVVGSVEVGSMPFALAAFGGSLYVGNADDGTVSVVDVFTNTVVDVIDVGANPFGLEVTGNRLYVADLAGTVSVIDLTDNTELVRIPVGGDPFGLAATADRVYVTNYSGGTVAVLNQATHTADPADTAGYPYVAAVVGGRLYVVNAATNALTIVDGSITTAVEVDPKTRAIDAIPPDAAPVDMIVRGDRLYVSNINRGTVTVVDVATNQPVETIAVGIQPGLMAASRDGRTIYVSDVMGGTVRVITSVRHAAR